MVIFASYGDVVLPKLIPKSLGIADDIILNPLSSTAKDGDTVKAALNAIEY